MEVANCFVGKRRTRYQNALRSLALNPLNREDERVKAFIKAEKTDPSAKVNPDPRMIQSRNARFNIVIGSYLKPMESQLYHMSGGHTKTRLMAKGLNQTQRATLLIRKMRAYERPAVVSIDASRWDKHCSQELLRIEHSVYLKMCPDPLLRRLLKAQLTNRVTTANGVKYTVKGNRMSGDMNTALGNCLLMIICIQDAMSHLCIGKYDILDDGDDCLIIVEESSLDQLQGLSDRFLHYGHELKIENVARTPEDVVFCQSHPIHLGNDRWTMVRPWIKVLSCGTSGTRHWGVPSMVEPMFGLVGDCELALNQGVPIIQAYAIALQRMSNGRRPRTIDFDDGVAVRAMQQLRVSGESLSTTLSKLRPVHVTDDARLSFERAYNVSIQRQLEIEKFLSGWTLSHLTAMPVAPELDHLWRQQLDQTLLGREIN